MSEFTIKERAALRLVGGVLRRRIRMARRDGVDVVEVQASTRVAPTLGDVGGLEGVMVVRERDQADTRIVLAGTDADGSVRVVFDLGAWVVDALPRMMPPRPTRYVSVRFGRRHGKTQASKGRR